MPPKRRARHDPLDRRARRPARDAGRLHRAGRAIPHQPCAGLFGRGHAGAAGDQRGARLAGVGRQRRALPARRLGRALRHRAGRRPAVDDDDPADLGAGGAGAAVRHRIRVGQTRAAFPRALPVPADGHHGGVPDRRRLQPLCLLRGAADRLLRADDPRRRQRAASGGHAIRALQPAGLDAVPLRAGRHLCRNRHTQHGRPCGPRGRDRPGEQHRHPRRGGAAAHGLRDQGGCGAAALLAAIELFRGARARRRAFRHHDKGRRLCDHPHLHDGVPARARDHGRAFRHLAAAGGADRPADRHDRRAGGKAAGPAGGLLGDRVDGDADDGRGALHARRHQRGAVLRDSFDAGHGGAVPDRRPGAQRTRRGRCRPQRRDARDGWGSDRGHVLCRGHRHGRPAAAVGFHRQAAGAAGQLRIAAGLVGLGGHPGVEPGGRRGLFPRRQPGVLEGAPGRGRGRGRDQPRRQPRRARGARPCAPHPGAGACRHRRVDRAAGGAHCAGWPGDALHGNHDRAALRAAALYRHGAEHAGQGPVQRQGQVRRLRKGRRLRRTR